MSDIAQADRPFVDDRATELPTTILSPAAHHVMRRFIALLPRQAALIGAALLSAGAAFVIMMQFASGPAPAMTPAPPPPASAWIDIVKPLAFFALPNTEFGREPTSYEARRHRTGAGRIDVLTFGQFRDAKKPYLRLSLYRVGAEEARDTTFFVDMARRASEAGLAVTRSEPTDLLPTRFGEFQVADLILAAGPSESSCVGFRRGADAGRFQVTGFACGAPSRPVDRTILACALDRLDLLAAAGDKSLSGLFARAEPGRGSGCPQPVRIATAPTKESWLDAGGKLPPLRTALQQSPRKTKK